MAKDYALRLSSHALQGFEPIVEITHRVEEWARSTTFTGGPWQGTFKVFGARDLLEQWFYEYLGYHVEETSFGEITWEGLIWEIDFVDFDKLHWTRFTQRGRRRRRTYENMFNRILCAYIPLLEVLQGYRGHGIGSELTSRMLTKLESFYMVDLLCDPALQSFYESRGMSRTVGMMIRRCNLQAGGDK